MVKIAIVGRPNVGKSTLFNRLAGRQLALVDDRPGVTRDRRFGTGRLGDLDLDLIDTAGFEDVTDESLEARMRRQTERAIDEAEVALFVIDAREGVTPLDQVFGELLRRRGKPVVLVANKAEGTRGRRRRAGGLRPGLRRAGGDLGRARRGAVGPLRRDRRGPAGARMPTTAERGEPPMRIAIVGRPNAGKSTLVNR